MFKIVYGAGHDLIEAGKSFEWHLNERVARYFAAAASQYEGVELLRTDDPTGNTEVRLSQRCRRANAWGADFALSIHHNAGAGNTSAGGIMGFAHRNASKKSFEYRDAIYDACVAATGLRGNRSNPKTTAGFYVLKYTDMPCVLMEYGFMDSTIDRDIIDTEEYAKKIAYATMEGIAMVAGLNKKTGAADPVPDQNVNIKEEEDMAYTKDDFIRDIQNAAGVAIDGVAGPTTLRNTVSLSKSKNRTSRLVLPVQKRLKALGYYKGIFDGIAGNRFDEAVRAYQVAIGNNVDGEITAGQRTWRHLLGME